MPVNGRALTVIRERTGMSKAELSRLTGIDQSVISRIESGVRRGTEAQAKALSTALDIPITMIVSEQVA